MSKRNLLTSSSSSTSSSSTASFDQPVKKQKSSEGENKAEDNTSCILIILDSIRDRLPFTKFDFESKYVNAKKAIVYEQTKLAT